MNSIIATLIESWNIPLSPLVLLSVATVLALFCWQFTLSNSLDPREPPEVKSKLPFIGHLIGLIWYQTEYFKILSLKCKLPIFTIRIFGTRIYVIGSPNIVQKVFSNPKAFAFETFVAEASRRLLSMDEAAMTTFLSSPPGFDDELSYAESAHNLIYESLAPGSSLSEMNTRFQTEIASRLNNFGTAGASVSLWHWTRDIITNGTCAAIYGFDNPVADDPSLIDSIEDFEANLNMFLMQFMPQIIARKAFQGRAHINSAFRKWFNAELWSNGAAIVQRRVKLARKHGFSANQVADYEMPLLFASLTNTIPFGFWMVSYIMADDELSMSIRKEIELVVAKSVVNGIETAEMDLTAIRTHCPLLISVWDELLRWNTHPTAVRSVTSDILLNNEHFLKAGAIVQMPSGITHDSPTVWGPDATEFNPRRFLKREKPRQEEREQIKLQNKAFFPFGGGKHFCPGRHMAFKEITAFVCMVLYAFTIETKDGTQFKVLQQGQRQLGSAINKPKGDADVMIRRREGFEGLKLAFKSEVINS